MCTQWQWRIPYSLKEALKTPLNHSDGATVAVCCGLAEQWLTILQEEQTKKKRRLSYLSGKSWVEELLSSKGSQCHENLRMSLDCFIVLRETLIHRGLLQNTRVMSIDKQLAIFLHTLAHNVTNRVAANRFNHSGAIVSLYFQKVLDAVCKVYRSYIQVPELAPTPNQIRINSRFYPYFKVSLSINCSFIIIYSFRWDANQAKW